MDQRDLFIHLAALLLYLGLLPLGFLQAAFAVGGLYAGVWIRRRS